MYEHIFKHVCLVVYAMHAISITHHRDELEEVIERDWQEELIASISCARKAKSSHHR